VAFLLGEPGRGGRRGHLCGGLISSVNYTETLTRRSTPETVAEAVADIGRLEVTIVPHDAELSAVAASLRPVVKRSG